ncbi:hypothetical protein ACQUFB_13405 [Enterococcus casseliflavus]|uniref:hypothetical protein n=1 Tax=Enterococcus casseliflavus TaxID=37734 RepID=UPI003D140EDF
MEYENVKEALKDAIEIAESEEVITWDIDTNSRLATTEEVQEMIRERLYNIADLLGLSELYLDK